MGKNVSVCELRKEMPKFNMFGVDITDPISNIQTIAFYDSAEVLHSISPTIIFRSGESYLMVRDIVHIEYLDYKGDAAILLECKNRFTKAPISIRITCSM